MNFRALAYAGVGEAVITKLFSTLIIHCLAHSNLKERERERENVLLYLSHLPKPHAVMHWRRKLTNQVILACYCLTMLVGKLEVEEEITTVIRSRINDWMQNSKGGRL